jgi:RNA-directed DNA polymerase
MTQRTGIRRELEAARNIAAGASLRSVDWLSIPWKQANRNVRRLQRRIVQAQQQGKKRKVRALQFILTRSFSARCLAVRRVTENSGKRTPGVDGQRLDTPAKKAQAVQKLSTEDYQAQPLKRTYIPKANGQLRPLGIPTRQDRAQQALHKLALEPLAETTADPNSYGFRKARSVADAIEQCHNALCRKTSANGILEADIHRCFDEISHEWLRSNIPMERALLRQWLAAGFLAQQVHHPTTTGTPQGGVSSPVLMNLTLDGLETFLAERFPPRSGAKVNFVRYADDVRHITRRQIPFTERRGSEEQTFGSTAYPLAKAKRNNSMPLTQERSEDVYALVLQDPRNMVKTALFEAQSPGMKAYILRPQRLKAESSR